MRLLLWFMLSALASVAASAGPEASTAATSGATSAVHAREDNVKHSKGLRGAVGILNGKHPARVDVDEERFAPLVATAEFLTDWLKALAEFASWFQEARIRSLPVLPRQ